MAQNVNNFHKTKVNFYIFIYKVNKVNSVKLFVFVAYLKHFIIDIFLDIKIQK